MGFRSLWVQAAGSGLFRCRLVWDVVPAFKSSIPREVARGSSRASSGDRPQMLGSLNLPVATRMLRLGAVHDRHSLEAGDGIEGRAADMEHGTFQYGSTESAEIPSHSVPSLTLRRM